MKRLISSLGFLLSPIAWQFERQLQKPQQSQRNLQQRFYRQLVRSDYGRSLGITDPANSAQNWHRIPIVTYQELEPWVQKQIQTQSSLLTSEKILFHEKTSGSQGTPKWIPYTQSLKNSFSRMFCLWAYDLIANGLSFSTGKIYFSISPQIGKSSTHPDHPTRIQDDSDYLNGWVKSLVQFFLVSPPELKQHVEPERFKQLLCSALLQTADLEIISIWSPTFLTVHLDYIQAHASYFQHHLMGKISPKRIQYLGEERIRWTQIWPQLKLISCWDSGHSAIAAEQLSDLFPGVWIQGKGLLATEAPITIPLIAAQGYVPLIDQVFLEFEDPETSEIKLLHQIKPGHDYDLIISQWAGLYRYRLGDRIRVSHFYHQTPCFECLGRSQTTSDLVGEKLHIDFVEQVLQPLPAQFKRLIPVTHPTAHYLLLLDRVEPDPEWLSRQLDQQFQASPHYALARQLGQLAPLEIWVSPQMPEIWIRAWIDSGRKWGDLKDSLLGVKPADPVWFNCLKLALDRSVESTP